LREVADGIRADHPDATWVSAGMSGDLEAAVAEGATHLRVGSAILGSRESHR
jgi:PLP dependent protein